MAQSHREIVRNDPDLMKLLAFDDNSNRIDDYDQEFVDRVT